MIQNPPGRFEPIAAKRTTIIVFLMMICVAWLYRYQILNGFSILAGDRYDGVISTTILEHWYNVVRGQANWSEVNYFFPHAHSLANTDGYFLIGMIYAPFRLFGLDPFLSAELANMVIKGIGFLGMYWMCRRVFSLPFQWAILAAVLYTLSNGMTTHAWRSQLATVAFSPYLATLLWIAGVAIKDRDFGKFRLFGSLAGLLFGAWCMTCFYAAWFFLYFFIVFAAIALICNGKSSLILLKEQITRHLGSYLVVLGVALLALAPFLYIFLPKSQETGVRSYSDSLHYAVSPEDIFQLGPQNFVVGKYYNQALLNFEPNYQPSNEYYNTGFGILLFVLFVFGMVRIFRKERKTSSKLILSFVLATALTWLTILKFNGTSAWYAVFHIIPGAKALRVVSAYYIFLALPITVIAIRYLTSIRISPIVAVLIAALLIVEELNTPIIDLVRKTELERIALAELPPAQCSAFYTSGWRDQATLPGRPELYSHNVTAMLIAQQVKIPTVNGFASFMAPDWDFANPQLPDYDARVRSYASKHDIKSLCRLDLNNKTWSMVDPATIRTIPIDVPFFEKSTWDGALAGFSGLSVQEQWGRWSDSKVVKFDFTNPLPPKFELHLTSHAYAVNAGKEFVAMLYGSKSDEDVSAGSVQKFSLPEADVKKVLRFDNPLGLRRIHIVVPQPITPRNANGSEDDRELGIGIVKLSIVPLQ
jgi:hypothetical protein